MQSPARPRRFPGPRFHSIRSAGAPALLLWAGTFAGCAGTHEEPTPAPGSAHVSQELKAEATVLSLDRSARLIGLRGKDGRALVVQAGPEVRNFAQIEVGDTVTVRYLESLAVSLMKPGESATPASAALAAGRAEPGKKPAAAVGAQVTVTVRIESVDTKKNLVVFTPPDGGLRAVHVQRPEGQRFIQGLKPGDQVEITYTEALAVSVEKQ